MTTRAASTARRSPTRINRKAAQPSAAPRRSCLEWVCYRADHGCRRLPAFRCKTFKHIVVCHEHREGDERPLKESEDALLFLLDARRRFVAAGLELVAAWVTPAKRIAKVEYKAPRFRCRLTGYPGQTVEEIVDRILKDPALSDRGPRGVAMSMLAAGAGASGRVEPSRKRGAR